jgi:1,4-alpha-glucan branching enzyme
MLTSKQQKKKIIFNLSAPQAERVYLAGDFNDWKINSLPLRPYKIGNGDTEWRATLQLRPGIYKYRYIVDGEWLNDPNCQEHVPNEFGTLNDVITI